MSGAKSRHEARGPARPVLIAPLRNFLHTEAAGGVALVVATLVALVWANSPWKASYVELWGTHLGISLGSHSIDLTLQEWVNDGLMAIFFFVVGLEIKRELAEGELRDPRRAALPAIAALGGMIVPALIYTAINAGGDGAAGWGIPMATDIAMAIGVLSLLGARVAPSLKLFLLALAIVDDIGAILVIAVFYSDHINLEALLAAVVLALAVVVARWISINSLPVYCLLGAAMWLAFHESGMHATLVGVVPRARGAHPPVAPPRADRRDRPHRPLHGGVCSGDDPPGPGVGLGGRVARAPPPPVDQLRDRAAVRPRERRHPAQHRARCRPRRRPGSPMASSSGS